MTRIAGYQVRRPSIVSHEMFGRMLQRHLLGLDPGQALACGHPSDVVYVIDPSARNRREVRPPDAPTKR